MKKLNSGINLIILKLAQVSRYNVILLQHYFYFRYLLNMFSNLDTEILSREVVLTVSCLFLMKSFRGITACIVVVRVITIGPCCLLSSSDLYTKRTK